MKAFEKMETTQKYFIIDFDSTFTKVEALDILCEISLKGSDRKAAALQKIQEITDLGMLGEISFRESLEQRISALEANKRHLPELVARLSELVSESFKRNREMLKGYSNRIIILSNGFRDFIVPIVEKFGILPENVFANEFIYDEEDNIVGFNKENLLSANNGKPKLIESLGLTGEIHVIGDGYNDYEIKAAGLAKEFYAFTENVSRDKVVAMADHIAPSLDEILFKNDMKRALSYPKHRIKVLLLENIHEHGVQKLKDEGYTVEVFPAGLDEDELAEKIKDVSIIGIRSKTRITKKVLDNAKRLLAVGAFCIGTNQIDLEECQRKGVAVFNAPFSNTRSVVELAIAEIIFLMRNLADKIGPMHDGKWNKSATNSFEIRGKKLGIIGYGNIGAQLSVVAESMGMDVYYYDLEERLMMGNATKCNSLDELLELADVITLHVDGRPENSEMIGAAEFEKMKDGVVFVNLARGHVVDIPALKSALASGKVRGTAVDVFPVEPMSNQDEFVSELRGMPNTILTPHIGGSTLEAQANIADFVPGKIIGYINTGSTANSVNFPNLVLPSLHNAHRFIHIHLNETGVLAEMNQTFAKHKLNIVGQYLKTNELIGYVITDIDASYPEEVVSDLKKIPGTIRFRVLY